MLCLKFLSIGSREKLKENVSENGLEVIPFDYCHQKLSYKNRLTSISLSSVLSYTKWIPIVTT